METKIKYEVVVDLKDGTSQLVSDPISGVKERFDKGHHSPLDMIEQKIINKQPIVIRFKNRVHIIPYDTIEFVSLVIVEEEQSESSPQNVVHFTPK